jgi:hypothetical protein
MARVQESVRLVSVDGRDDLLLVTANQDKLVVTNRTVLLDTLQKSVDKVDTKATTDAVKVTRDMGKHGSCLCLSSVVTCCWCLQTPLIQG